MTGKKLEGFTPGKWKDDGGRIIGAEAPRQDARLKAAEDALIAAKMDYGDIAAQINELLSDRTSWMDKHLALDTKLRECEEALERIEWIVDGAWESNISWGAATETIRREVESALKKLREVGK